MNLPATWHCPKCSAPLDAMVSGPAICDRCGARLLLVYDGTAPRAKVLAASASEQQDPFAAFRAELAAFGRRLDDFDAHIAATFAELRGQIDSLTAGDGFLASKAASSAPHGERETRSGERSNHGR